VQSAESGLPRESVRRELSEVALQSSDRHDADGEDDNQLQAVEDHLSAKKRPSATRMAGILPMD
jgi:hypothetical protein